MKRIFATAFVLVLIVMSPALAAEGTPAEGQTYTKVVLWAVGYNATDKAKIESGSVKTFTKKGINAIAMSDLVPDPLQYSRAELRQKFADNGIDAVFEVVDLGNPMPRMRRGGFTEALVETPVQSQGGASASMNSSNIGAGGGQKVMLGMGGSSFKEKKVSKFGIYLSDLSTGALIWQDEVTAKGRLDDKDRVLAGKAMRKGAKKAIKQKLFASENGG